MKRTVELSINGRGVTVAADSSVAAALLDAGVRAFRSSVSSEPRSALCGMGVCFECRVAIDGIPHRRACLVQVADGMQITTAEGSAA